MTALLKMTAANATCLFAQLSFPFTSFLGNHHHHEQYFCNLLATIREELMPQIPSIDSEELSKSLATVVRCQKIRDMQKRAQDRAKSEEDKKKASQALAQAEKAVVEATDAAIAASTPVLMSLQETLLHNDSLDALLVRASILHNASKQLADYCKQGEAQSKLVIEMLSDTMLIREILYNGGAKGGNYGQAMEIYTSLLSLIQSNGDNEGILHRLALGTSLEHAVPVAVFGAHKQHISPIQRFQHYQQAFLNHELDPTFASQSTWNLRNTADSDATNEQLAWGRDMLRNYRPDIMALQDYKWRYCLIVKSDVVYCKPTWTSHPKTYDQILCGGGMCGPRAWMGRFACKAFDGIPTWGVRQPGHAAVGHWMPDHAEWVTCLGAAWKFSYWED